MTTIVLVRKNKEVVVADVKSFLGMNPEEKKEAEA